MNEIVVSAGSPAGITMTHLRAEAVLRKVLTAFERESIACVAVKGIVTAYELYSQIGERNISDIDLRIGSRDLDRVESIVQAERWELRWRSRAYSNIVFRVDGMSVDVETMIGPPGLCAIDVEAMIARSKWAESAGGCRRRQPEIHDHALLLCINIFKDKFTGAFAWSIEDVERIAKRSEFDVERFIALTREGRVEAIVWVVADWMATERGSVAWRAIRDRIGASPRPLYAWLLGRLRRDADSSLAFRVLARMASDSALAWPRALYGAAGWEIEARRRGAE